MDNDESTSGLMMQLVLNEVMRKSNEGYKLVLLETSYAILNVAIDMLHAYWKEHQ